jgi:hypothetical protein
MTERRVRIRVTRSGGMAGTRVRASLDTHDLGEEEAEAVRHLVDRIDLTGPLAPGRHRPDEFQYDLDMVRDDEHQEVSIPEHALTPELRELVRHVLRHGAEKGPR